MSNNLTCLQSITKRLPNKYKVSENHRNKSLLVFDGEIELTFDADESISHFKDKALKNLVKEDLEKNSPKIGILRTIFKCFDKKEVDAESLRIFVELAFDRNKTTS